MAGQLVQFGKQLGYQFKDTALLNLALTHRSHKKHNNERLEFLGDSILGFVIAEGLFSKFPTADEGQLTRLRASLVKKETLAKIARGIDLGAHITLGTGERRAGGWRRESILANTVESIFGAIYLDAGFCECRRVINTLYQVLLDEITLEHIHKDAKTQLQEYLQARKLPLPAYEIIKQTGEDHDKTFSIKCCVVGMDESVIAEGTNKRMAEQRAADKMIALLNSQHT